MKENSTITPIVIALAGVAFMIASMIGVVFTLKVSGDGVNNAKLEPVHKRIDEITELLKEMDSRRNAQYGIIKRSIDEIKQK